MHRSQDFPVYDLFGQDLKSLDHIPREGIKMQPEPPKPLSVTSLSFLSKRINRLFNSRSM
jgi:hypothetical protein